MTDKLPVVDLSNFLNDKTSATAAEDCKKIAQILRDTSCLIIKDPRVSESENNNFINMMEKYYEQPLEAKMKDVHPELHYQLGATPEFVEVPRDHTERINQLSEENAAHTPKGADPKWRYFWRIGSRPEVTKFTELNAPEVVPESFPQWTDVMNNWGNLMMQAIRTTSEMIAVGLDMPNDAFLSLLNNGPHLLAPTGSNLGSFHDQGTVFAGYHYDLNFLTIHGKSRFPGLYIWLRDGTKMSVKVPDGCLLIQAGKQIEWLTGGHISAGFHEVVVSPATVDAVKRAQEEGRSLWRVSSTLFSHIASDATLQPLGKFANEESLKNYPAKLTGEQVQEELDLINLSNPNNKQ